MFFLFLKSCVARKYIGITNQTLDKKNLNDTTGIVLVKLVRKIHPKLI
jgi:hypothetical protein